MKKSAYTCILVSVIAGSGWLPMAYAEGVEKAEQIQSAEGIETTRDPRPLFQVASFATKERVKLEEARACSGKRPSSLVHDVIAIITKGEGPSESGSLSTVPAYKLNRSDVIALLGSPSLVDTNDRGDEVLVFDVEVDDPITKSMKVVIEIDTNGVRRVLVPKEL